MQQLSDFLNEHGDLRNYKSEVADKVTKSLQQAADHMTRSKLDRIIKKSKPHEDEIYTSYRNDNKRNVTNDFIQQFVRMLQRICSQSIPMDYEAYEALDIYANNVVIPTSVYDANALLVEWPEIPDRPSDPPSLRDFAQNMPITSKTLIVYSPLILVDNENFAIWRKDFVKVGEDKIQRFIAVDNRAFQILTPKKDSKGVIYYESSDWYVHGLGRVPVAHLPAIITTEHIEITDALKRFQDQKFITYRESICFPAFEWFDEAINLMSSWQVAANKYINPKLVINAEIDCPDCGGEGFKGYDTNNKPIVCKTCSGSRKLANVGDFSHVNIAQKNAVDKGVQTSNPIYYLNPPAGIKEVWDAFMACIAEGKKSLCNDPLETTGNESGVAKEMRLEPKQDLMKAYGIQLCQTLQDMVNNRGQLRDASFEPISITPPLYYETKSPDVLKEQVLNSLHGDRYINYMKWVDATYRKDEYQIRRHMFAVLYAPLCLYGADEFDSVFNAGVYDERDAIRRDYAFYAVDFVLGREPSLDSLKDIKEKCDAFLIEQGVLPEVSDMRIATTGAIQEPV